MPAHLEITDPGGGKRAVPIWHGTFVLGADPRADVRVEAPGMRPQHLRFVPVDGMVRVEPCAAGATVEVNGEQLFGKDLRDGDVIRIGAVQIRWVDPQSPPPAPPQRALAAVPAARAPRPKPTAPPPVAEAGPRAPVATRGAAKPRRPEPRVRPERRRGDASWAVVGAVVVVIVLVGYGLVQHFSQSTWPSSPQHYVDLAREQLANRQPERALATLAFARKDATGAVRLQAEQLEAEIRRLMVETAAMPKVSAARAERDLLQGFATRYLAGPAARPAARELVRRCDQWLANHREVCANHSDGKEPLREVEELRNRHVAAAQLDTPETAADVLFVVQERLGLRWRDYKTAVARIDAFLQRNPGVDEVVQRRAQMLAEGETWLRSRLDNLGTLLARGDVGNARRDLEELDRKSVLPEWAPLVAPMRDRIAAAR